ncbi:hypothetical protein M2401_000800 [Pseudomonas sp. JUb42]|uniref:hypothetical protein n=1 Tax=Pseudomonas sp. JUb42 TaxID=2940611 RepID=UPI0021699DC4|nr:hypothetical protein [Pseudomonas sp. JUb42]MCS3467079.1 hypothetical protein [Pseudomonas sp. JUb42]
MVTPVIDLLPSPPVPTDSPPAFATKAGAFVTAQAAMVPQLNAAFAWQAASEAASLGYKNAAATSATAADASSTAAAGQVTLAAAQVALAATQASNAASSASQAQIAAAAAGSAAGLPSFTAKDAFDVLQINSAKNGVQWGKAGQSVGDILVTARAPGATYANGNRFSYLQSIYPDLYALIGALPDADRSTISTGTLNASFPSDALSSRLTADSGSLLIALCTNVAFCYTSADRGVTWVRRATPVFNWKSITVKSGLFLAATTDNPSQTYTTTDGVTWTARAILSLSPQLGAVAGLFVLIDQTGADAINHTSPDGITWTSRAVPTDLPIVGLFNVNGFLISLTGNSAFYSYTSDGISWARTNTSGNFQSIQYVAGTYFAVNNAADGGLFTATSLAGPWTKTTPLLIPSGGFSTFAGSSQGAVSSIDGVIIFPTNGTAAWVSNDSGKTWDYRITTANFSSPLALPGRFLQLAAANTTYSMPLRSYDSTTSFITPKSVAQPPPLTTYIKGKLV